MWGSLGSVFLFFVLLLWIRSVRYDASMGRFGSGLVAVVWILSVNVWAGCS